MTTAIKEAVYTRPWLYPKQHDAIFDPARYSVIEASTKSGKTVGCIVWITEQAMQGKAGWNYWWVAPIYPQAKIAFRRLKRALPQELYEANETELTITLANGTIIWFKGADNPDSLYGEDVYAAVLDEATRMKEEAWFAVRTTLTATRGPVRIISNVKGRRNWAYRMARRAEAKDPNMAYHKLICHDAVEAGVLSEEEVLDAQRQLPKDVFEELYLAKATEDGSNPFGLHAIAECVAPLGEGPAVAWGWDLARGKKAGSDWTVGIGLNKDRAVCGFDRFQAPWNQQIERIRWLTGIVPALVDATGVGDPIVEELQRGPGNYEGFNFTSQSKQQIMEGLALVIQRSDIRFPDGVIVVELETFEYEYTRTGVRYSAPEGLNDDCVCGLALGNHHFRDSGPPRLRYVG
ncbi:MAG TPA: phage terminase large subunit [Anaerolineae bacterium]|nr:phage terminase large subunit [Anaerolineae bacterium]HUW96004.1 phage terminase large subunit [Anaerolineae bacterium]